MSMSGTKIRAISLCKRNKDNFEIKIGYPMINVQQDYVSIKTKLKTNKKLYVKNVKANSSEVVFKGTDILFA